MASMKSKIAGSLGLAAVTAAAYYFYGNKGKQHRKAVKAWGKKARSEMLQKMKKMKTISRATYQKAAKQIMAKYKLAKNVDSKELAALGRDLRTGWNKISKNLSGLGKKAIQ